MEKHTCKLCFRSFANGRALGGHMRSHVATSTKALWPSESPSSRNEEEDDVDGKMGPLGYGLRENPNKSLRLLDPEFSSVVGSSIIVQDRESETESSLAPAITHRWRSKRARKDPIQVQEPEPVSSVSNRTPEEDVALSLMILSRDFWAPVTKSTEQLMDKDEEEYEIGIEEHRSRNNRSRYQCRTCKKVFRSYQALGGHRASHKKANGCVPPAPIKNKDPLAARILVHDANAERVHHECPVCYRVFSSGQALGGHKRSHLRSSWAATITLTSSSCAPAAAAPIASKFGESLIDLNLPAPMEDDAEVSAVSDAGFVMTKRSK
ncbi:LOW QUALITY PROTEIN: zinc finger protein ZAT9-like [Asparagus officinalis]|uniref:LOW QUALITY PROTEIN: zinc finger protein ZAT9-like n=1 Tax=Asparagus officinalis TaxID=4686 RepID=UPI00098E4257|nr:LOW QUALITY PROTEIN: zinc finger protein ZAT9-like [Asparagus officinalis]